MSEFLTIRLSSNPTDSIAWLVWSSSESDIIASGELPDRSHIGFLTQYSQQRTIIALLPSSEVLLTQITVPAGVSRQFNAMLPFLMEDELVQDIDEIHFSVLSKKGDQAVIASLDKAFLAEWLEDFKQVGIEITKAIPDCLALPQHDNQASNQVSAMQLGSQWLLRQGETKGASVDKEWLGLFLNSGWLSAKGADLDLANGIEGDLDASLDLNINKEDNLDGKLDLNNFSIKHGTLQTGDALQFSSDREETRDVVNDQLTEDQVVQNPDTEVTQSNPDGEKHVTIYSYTELPDDHLDLPGKWVEAEPELLMSVLIKEAISSSANLLTGEFKVESSWLTYWHIWKKVSIAACVLIALVLTNKTIQVNRMEEQVSQYHEQSEQVFRTVFPDKQKIPTVSYLKRQLNDEKNRLSGGGDGESYNDILNWIGYLPEALKQAKGLTLQTVKFDSDRGELQILVRSGDFQSFERLRTELTKQFSVEQGQLSRQDDYVLGSYVIRSKS